MRTYSTIPAAALVIVALCCRIDAKDWRGLIPLHSTRADVEKLLGAPPPPPSDGHRQYTLNDNRSIYFVDGDDIYIVYARQTFPDAPICPKTVPNDTVLMIQVTLKNRLPLQQFPIDIHRSQQFDPSEPKNIGYKTYLDKRDGIMVTTFKGNVADIWYFATSEDARVCPTYYANMKSFAGMLVDYF
jgi:hypothetical protein